MANSILIISSYPEKGLTHSAKIVGVASYTKNTLLSVIKQNPKLKITVLAEKLDNINYYSENEINIRRVWQRNDLVSLFKLVFEVIKSKAGKVIIPFEINMFGSFFHTITFLLLLPIIKLTNKKIIFIMHQVVENFQEIEKNQLKAKILNLEKNILYRYLLMVTNRIVVFEEQLKTNLGSNRKVIVIPHAIEDLPKSKGTDNRTKYNLKQTDKTILYFGYLSPYKGLDELIANFQEVSGWRLIIAGGGNPNLMKNKPYRSYVDYIVKQSNNCGAMTTGFIPQNEIPDIFSVADIVILPYKSFLSSSGPLSMAFGYEKAILLSKPLNKYFKTDDLKEALIKTGLTTEDVTIDLLNNELKDKLNKVKQNLSAMQNFSKIIKRERSWTIIAKKYLESVFN